MGQLLLPSFGDVVRHSQVLSETTLETCNEILWADIRLVFNDASHSWTVLVFLQIIQIVSQKLEHLRPPAVIALVQIQLTMAHLIRLALPHIGIGALNRRGQLLNLTLRYVAFLRLIIVASGVTTLLLPTDRVLKLFVQINNVNLLLLLLCLLPTIFLYLIDLLIL